MPAAKNHQVAEILALSIALTYSSPKESLRLAKEASQLADAQCEPKLHIAALHQQMSMLFAFGQIHEGCHILLTALVIAETQNLESERGDLLQHLGVAHYTLGEYVTAIDYWSDCLHLGHADFTADTRINAHIGIGQIYFACNQFEDALRHHQLAERWLTPEVGDELRVRLLVNLIADLYELARYDEADVLLIDAESMCKKIKHLEYLGEVFSYKTLIALAREQYPKANQYIIEGQQLVRFWAWGEISWNIVAGRTQQAEHQYTAALDSFQSALNIANTMNCGHKIFMIHKYIASIYRELQQNREAEYHHRLYHENYHRLIDPVIFTRLKQLEVQVSTLS